MSLAVDSGMKRARQESMSTGRHPRRSFIPEGRLINGIRIGNNYKKDTTFCESFEAKNTAAYSVSWTNKKRQGGGG